MEKGTGRGATTPGARTNAPLQHVAKPLLATRYSHHMRTFLQPWQQPFWLTAVRSSLCTQPVTNRHRVKPPRDAQTPAGGQNRLRNADGLNCHQLQDNQTQYDAFLHEWRTLCVASMFLGRKSAQPLHDGCRCLKRSCSNQIVVVVIGHLWRGADCLNRMSVVNGPVQIPKRVTHE